MRERVSPVGGLLEVAEGRAVDLARDGVAQTVAGLLGDVAHDPGLRPRRTPPTAGTGPASVARRMRPMASKSIEPVPAAEATAPSKSTVVASESTLGPTMENAVEAMANRNTSRSRPLNCPMKASIRFSWWGRRPAPSHRRVSAGRPGHGRRGLPPRPPGPRRGPPPALGMKEGCPLIAHPPSTSSSSESCDRAISRYSGQLSVSWAWVPTPATRPLRRAPRCDRPQAPWRCAGPRGSRWNRRPRRAARRARGHPWRNRAPRSSHRTGRRAAAARGRGPSGKPLALAAGDVVASLGDGSGKASLARFHEIQGAGHLKGAADGRLVGATRLRRRCCFPPCPRTGRPSGAHSRSTPAGRPGKARADRRRRG